MQQRLELRILQSLTEIDPQQWESLQDSQSNPFVSWTFLEALEASGCTGAERGWWPCHLTAWNADRLVAAAPAYIKMDSAGDFSRDWGFAEVVQRAGVRYYPKLVIAAPFSPVTGRRFLVHGDYDRTAMIGALVTLARELARENQLSSLHVLYHHPDETEALQRAGLVDRVLIQYHWKNRDFGSLEDWLGSLKSKKRTQVRREMAEPARQGISIRTVRGDEMRDDPQRWGRSAYSLYQRNTQKHFWGGAYLNRAFYERICERMSDHAELVIAERDGRIVAGAFNIATPTHLYGRYWGCHEEHRFLHFNVCLYHSIEECIERGIQVFEGGAGGEHKLSRGFEPSLVHLAHGFVNAELDELMGRYLNAESRARREQLRQWQAGRVG